MNYYKILNVNKNATEQEIKQSYRKLALKWHPDKNIENKELATKKFKEITEAYQILKDPQSRYNYDNEINQNIKFQNPDDVFKTFFGKSRTEMFNQNYQIVINSGYKESYTVKKVLLQDGFTKTYIITTKNYGNGENYTTVDENKENNKFTYTM